jgi:DNA-binding NarL/FixJ family response regulator
MADLRLLIVAADSLARAGLATLLNDRSGLRIIGQIDMGQSLPAEVDVYQPDVIVWDLGWEPEESLIIMEELAAENETGQTAIVALILDEETAAAAWSAGARGLLFRDVTVGRLLAAIRAADQGLATVEPELLANLLPAGPLEEPNLVEELTPREVEVLQLLAEGLANKAIARQLDISEHTVKFHVNAIMSKLGAQSRTAAVVRATRLGLIML